MIKNLKNFLESYASGRTLRAHMPGHKGKALLRELDSAYQWDITEIWGADSLFEAEGILREAERRTAETYHVPETCWSAGGSTLCIQAMLAQMKAEGRVVISARTVHRAFLNSCVLLDLPVRWVFPRTGGIISGDYCADDFEKALQETSAPACIYVTSPDYTGNQQDIRALADICRKHDARLLVDNAHGAHLAFLESDLHPIALGADYCCDSAHKTLPALTGGAFLHMKDPSKLSVMKQHMQMFGSTSPSYLIMQSLEACTDWLREQGSEQVQICAGRVRQMKQRFADKFEFIGTDPMHLTIRTNGLVTAGLLRNGQFPVECEYADQTCIVLLLSPMMTERDFEMLEAALGACPAIPAVSAPDLPPPMKQMLSIRRAALSPYEMLPLSRAEGRICASVLVPCPPAVPVAVSGEQLSQEWLDLMAFYGLEQIAAVQNQERFS